MELYPPWYHDLPAAMDYLTSFPATMSEIVHIAHTRSDISNGGTVRSMIGVLRTKNRSIGFWYQQRTVRGLEQEGGWAILEGRILPAEVAGELTEKESTFVFGLPPDKKSKRKKNNGRETQRSSRG